MKPGRSFLNITLAANIAINKVVDGYLTIKPLWPVCSRKHTSAWWGVGTYTAGECPDQVEMLEADDACKNHGDTKSVTTSSTRSRSGSKDKSLKRLLRCFFKSRGWIFDLIISPVSNISRVTARWQGHQTDFWNVPYELQSMWWTSKYTFSETEMSFFKVTGASVRGSRVSNLRSSLRGWRKCGWVQLELAHKNKNKTHCRDQEEVTSLTIFSNFRLTCWNRFA